MRYSKIKNFIFLSALVLWPLTGFAQVSKTPTFLWMVLSKKDSTPSFILGTVHHMGPKPILANSTLMKLVVGSRAIVQEADTTELFHNKDDNFKTTTNTALDDLLGYADYQFVKSEFFHATGDDLENYKYEMPQVILQIIGNAQKKKAGLPTKEILMENAFYAVSILKNIPIYGLENRAENFHLMYETMPLSDQAKMLMISLKDLKFTDRGEMMSECFHMQDLDCLCKIDDFKNYTRPGDLNMIVARNLFWFPKITKHIESGNTFIAVGAAHLCGKAGIINLLKSKGYLVVPIKTEK